MVRDTEVVGAKKDDDDAVGAKDCEKDDPPALLDDMADARLLSMMLLGG